MMPGIEADALAPPGAPDRAEAAPASSRVPGRPARELVRRHSAVVRITHWSNLVCFVVLLMSGLQIFNAHPALYWGKASDFQHPALAITDEQNLPGTPRGITTIGGWRFDTTGVLGLTTAADGTPVAHAFPGWATLPSWRSLADGRRWHFFFAWLLVLNGLAYLLYGALSRHLWRDLVPTRHGLARLGHTVWEHLRLRFPKGEEARHYNPLQQIAYLAVVLVAFPVLILAGLAMSPQLNAAWPWLLDIFGGRQSARTVHFIAAFTLVGFILLHVFMVIVSGLFNNLRSMVTGRYAIEPAGERHE